MTTALTGLTVGSTCEPRTFGPLTRAMFVRYAGASGDFNPIHFDDGFARAAGFPSVFSQGMHQAALLATFATDWLGAGNVRRFHVRFREQVWPGDVLTCEGEVTAVQPQEGDGRLLTVDFRCVRQTGGVAISGSADFLIDAVDGDAR
ncbi:MaoC/PaaZ C-terminal domain-containing protein [Streptomyces sp. NPDC056660]|uniref:MaoC/PaaZ C-terminal domain-containing protein n=1 Tax=Streptomyces sp. NPDC056660 TaxID=3345897 RepID=UPI00368B4B00